MVVDLQGNSRLSSSLHASCALLPSPARRLRATRRPRHQSFLFVQTAKDIAFRDGVLTLQHVSPVTVFFADRPQRIVGHVRNDFF